MAAKQPAAEDQQEAQQKHQQRSRSKAEALMRPLNAFVERYIPSAYLLAVFLTLVVAITALIITDAGPDDVLVGWGDGLSGLLEFTMQMVLILLLGHMLAHTGPVHNLLVRLGSVPRSEGQAYIFVVSVTAGFSLIQWGIGLVVGAVLAKEVARQGKAKGLRLHFPLLVAAGYSGWVVWHMGYSGTSQLINATEDSFVTEITGVIVPVSETTFSAWNITGAVIAVVAVSLTMYALRPKVASRIIEVDTQETAALQVSEEVESPADRLDVSRVPTLLLGLAIAGYIVLYFLRGGSTTIDIVNWTFMCLILLLSKNAREVLALTKNSASNVGDVAFQYPLYAGILGIMSSTGLMVWLTERFADMSNEYTFGIIGLLAAGLVNIFVPSGGGQLAVQGPVMIEAAQEIGVDPAIAVMAVAYGDQWTNMIQPFWALPLLAIAGLKIRDVLGYTMVTFVVSGVVFAGTLLAASFIL